MSFTAEQKLVWVGPDGRPQTTYRTLELRCFKCGKATRSHTVEGVVVCHTCYCELPKCSTCGTAILKREGDGPQYCGKCAGDAAQIRAGGNRDGKETGG